MSTFLARLQEFRRRHTGVEGLFWIKRVNHPAGSVIALLLLPTRVTPNMVSIAGLLVHVAAAAVLLTSPVPATPVVWLFMIVAWQLAFSLDCADGQLARARKRTSPFGAFFDQVIDVATHALVYTSLSVYVIRALALDAVYAALLVALVFSLNFLQLYTTWGRNQIMGTEPAIKGAPPGWLGLLMRGKDLLDYGAYLFVAGVLLPWPVLSLWFLVGYAAVSGLATVAQVSLNWRRSMLDWRELDAREARETLERDGQLVTPPVATTRPTDARRGG